MSSEIVNPKMTFKSELRFTPYAWAKLLFMRDHGNTEVAGYCVTGTEDPLLVTDFRLIKSVCTGASFDMDPEDGAEFMESMLDAGLMPWQYSNILAHTHPGNSPSPSDTDEKNFIEAFSHPNWAIMFIIADGGASYCRMKINVGPGVERELKVVTDWSATFSGSDLLAWIKEYDDKVVVEKFRMTGKEGKGAHHATHFPDHNDPIWWDEEWDEWHRLQGGQKTDIDGRDCTGGQGDSGTASQDGELEDLDCWWTPEGDVEFWDVLTDQWFLYDPTKPAWYLVGDDNARLIDKPQTPWACQVAAWAVEYANERPSVANETINDQEDALWAQS